LNSGILKSSLLHASGKPMVMLGGDVYEQLTKGDIVHEYKWVDGKPVMLIYKRVLGNNTPAYMIELSDAHEYATSAGGPTKALLGRLCFDAAKVLRAENDKATLYRLIDVIVEGMDILLKMPPEPKAIEIANRPSTGNDELTIKVDGQVIAEVQL
jgi:hypothetical protein